MLASRMPSASLATRSSILLHTTTTSSTAILRAARLPRKSRSNQTRSFRFGLWSSYLDLAFQKELQRRHRVIKHKYADALYRKLSWDRHSPIYTSRWGLKGLMCSSWRGHDPRPGGRWVNLDEMRHMRENLAATSIRGIEEVEQNAIDKLFGRERSQKVLYNDSILGWTWAATESTSADPEPQPSKRTPEKRTKDRPISRKAFESTATKNAEPEYIIDPITNRKVFKNSTTKSSQRSQEANIEVTDIPVKTFKGYRSQFSMFEPPKEAGEGKAIHLDGKKPTGAATSFKSEITVTEEELEKYRPYKYNEPDGKFSDQRDTVTEGLSDFDHTYKPFKYNEPDGKFPEQPDPVSDCLNDFKHQYKPFKYNEPDGKIPDQPNTVSEGLSDFDHPYNPFKYNEPDGQFPENSTTVLEGLTDFDHQYKPFKYNEPDGKLSETSDPVENGLNDYDRQQIRAEQSSGDGYQSKDWLSQEGFASDAAIRRERPAIALSGEKRALHEPRMSQLSYSRLSTSSTVDAEKQEDLDLLRASDVRAASGILKRREEETRTEKDSRRVKLEADFDAQQDLQKLQAEDKAAAEKVKESRQLARDLEIERSYLLNHNAHARSRVNAKIAELDSEIAAETSSATAPKKMTGNFVRDFPEEFSASWITKGPSTNCLIPNKDTDAWGYDKSPKGLELSYQTEKENVVQSAENDYASEMSSQGGYVQGTVASRLETALERSLSAYKERAQAEKDPYTKEPQGLETSYAEEVAKDGSCQSPMFITSYGCEKAKTEKEKDKALVREIRGIYESIYGTIDSKHRQVPQNDVKVDSPLNNASSAEVEAAIGKLEQEVREGQYYVHDRYMDVAKVLAKQVPAENAGSDSAKQVDSSASTTSAMNLSTPEPVLYKILAYDPIMQNIKTAETTSIVTDTSSALTPAEVLLRLSNPAKFFPHFQPLQSQGYEIVSGSGDVLVFRKVRDSAPANIEGLSSSIPSPGRKVVNPIDGMQSIPQPATGNFASPTGFVNHNLPSEHPFVSGIDVRREEPVFSGRQNRWQGGENGEGEPKRKAKKTGRGLLIGAAWVAACSYAVGVVAEYFKTGGSDGKGPVGF